MDTEDGPTHRSDSHSERSYDLIVIGSGPAGIHAAVQASKLKKKVCIVEKMKEKLGGGWIHTGTLPSKTLRESLATIHSIQSHVGRPWVDRIIENIHTDRLYHRANTVSDQEEELIRKHLKNNNIQIIEGYGSIESEFSVRILPSDNHPFTIQGNYILIATGSRPRRPEHIPFDGWRVVDSDEILSLEKIPKKMIIYGAGVIGCEYACIFSTLSVEVTVIDSRSRILQYLDNEIGNELQRSMESLGVKFILGSTIDEIHLKGPQVLCIAGEKSFETEVLFYAAGRISCSNRIGLKRVGIQTSERGAAIIVNNNFQTRIPNIYAAGDAIGPPALAATSSQQGRHVACHAFSVNIGDFPEQYPIGVYTIPELSMVGKTEEELKKENRPYVVGHAQYSEIARGYIRGDTHGLLKILVCQRTHKILGIHIVGDDACNLIHIGVAFMLKSGTVQDILTLIFNYPTLAEGYRIAAFNALNKIFTDGIIRAAPKEDTEEPTIELAKSS